MTVSDTALRGYRAVVAEYIEQFGLLALFVVIAVQAAGIGGPPGKTALVVAALLAADGHFPIVAVVLVAATASTAGGYVGYAVARKIGRRLLERPLFARHLGRWIAIAERFFAAHGPKAVFAARFFPGLKVVAAPAAGISHMPWRAFALWHGLGSIAFALVFGLGTYFVGRSAIELVEHYGLIALIPVAAALAIGAAVLARVKRRARPAELDAA